MACFCSSLHQPSANMGGRASCGCEPEGAGGRSLTSKSLYYTWVVHSLLKCQYCFSNLFSFRKIWRHFEIQYIFVSSSKRKTNLCPVSFPPPFLPVETPPHPLGSFVSPPSQEWLNHESLDWSFSCPVLPFSESRVEAGPCIGTALGVWNLL